MRSLTFVVEDCTEDEIVRVADIFGGRVKVTNNSGKLIDLEKISKTFNINIGSVTYNRDENTFSFKGKEIDLTSLEKKILAWFFINPNRVGSREVLLDIIYGPGSDNDYRTVDTTIKRVRSKIKKIEAYELHFMIKTLYGEGYKLDTKAKKDTN